MHQNTKNNIVSVIVLIFVILVTVGAIQFLGIGIDLLRKKLDLPIQNISESKDGTVKNSETVPEIADGETVKEVLVKIPLLVSEYRAPSNIYTSAVARKQNTKRLALIGKFSKAKLQIKGRIENKLSNFISLNIGNVSGTLGGYRKNPNTLDINQSTGVLNEQTQVDLDIDLMEAVRLSTTREEFSSNFQPFKNVVLWDAIKPQPSKNGGTIAGILVAPYNEKGAYGDGIIITEMTFSYTCLDGNNSCAAALCEATKFLLGSECLKDKFEKKFGPESWKNYSQQF